MTAPLSKTSEGERRKREAFAALQAHRDVYIRRGRRALLTAMLHNDTATIDAARAVVELPPDLGPKLFGVVPGRLVRLGIVQPDGFIKSTRALSHARPIQRWRLIDRDAALAWLRDHPDRPDPVPPDECEGSLFPLNNKGTSPAVAAAELV